MARLVHITSEPVAARARRYGLRPSRVAEWYVPGTRRALWTFPQLESYTLTHSWARELKRFGQNTLSAVTILVPDDEPVLVGHYRSDRISLTAAEAVGIVRSQVDPRGYEVLILRRVEAREITGVRVLPRAFGWRYSPEMKGSGRMACDCPVCAPRGEVKARRYRERIPLLQASFEARLNGAREPKD